MGVRLAQPPPPTTLDRSGGGSDWVILMRAANDIDAHLLCGRLKHAGVEYRGVKDRYAPGAWLIGGSNPWAPVVVYVKRFQLEDARIVLAEIAYENACVESERRGSARRG